MAKSLWRSPVQFGFRHSIINHQSSFGFAFIILFALIGAAIRLAPSTLVTMHTDATPSSKPNRRDFLRTAVLGLGALGLGNRAALAAEQPAASFARASKLRLGLVTYNLAKDWDIPTIIRNCADAKFEGVELRTTHAHGVEVTLSKAQREEVKRKFRDSNVALMGLGSAFDYHTPDQAKLGRTSRPPRNTSCWPMTLARPGSRCGRTACRATCRGGGAASSMRRRGPTARLRPSP